MLDRVAVNEPEFGPLIARIAGTSYNPAIDVNFARIIDGKFAGGVIFNDYTHESIGLHVGANRGNWINRDMLWVTFDYPFRLLKVKRLFGQVPESNIWARKFNEKLGFRVVARVEGVYPNDIACLVMRMDREDCKYLHIEPRSLAA